MRDALSTIVDALLLMLGLIVAAVMLYLAPTFVAMMRGARNIGSVAVINVLLLGWLFIPWVIALAMAFSDPRHNG